MPPTCPCHIFTLRTLWNGSCATFTHKLAWGTAFAFLLDGSTKSEEGTSELTIWRDVPLQGETMATYVTTEWDIYSMDPFRKSPIMFMDDDIDAFLGVWLVDIQGE
jgi:hypothetical protein